MSKSPTSERVFTFLDGVVLFAAGMIAGMLMLFAIQGGLTPMH